MPLRVACDVRNPLLGERGAARVFGPQKGADPAAVEELEARLAALEELAPYRDLPGAGAGGGLGAAFAALGGELVEGAELVLDTDRVRRRARAARTSSSRAKAPSTRRRSRERRPAPSPRAVRGSVCAASSSAGIVRDGVDARALSGRRSLAGEDLVQLGEELGIALVRGAGA